MNKMPRKVWWKKK